VLQAGRLRCRFPMSSLDFFSLLNPSSCTMALGSTQPLAEMSTRNLPGGEGVKSSRRLGLATSPPSVSRLSRKASTNCYRVSFTLTAQETHYVTATKTNRLMPFRETVAIYCENHTEHTDALCRQNAEF
jgi:hypothetical protein